MQQFTRRAVLGFLGQLPFVGALLKRFEEKQAPLYQLESMPIPVIPLEVWEGASTKPQAICHRAPGYWLSYYNEIEEVSGELLSPHASVINWQSVEEGLPELCRAKHVELGYRLSKDVHMIVNGKVSTGHLFKYKGDHILWVRSDGTHYWSDDAVTHWAPFPEVPAGLEYETMSDPGEATIQGMFMTDARGGV